MTGWVWSDPRWTGAVGSSVDETVREALRRAIDLRDTPGHVDGAAGTKAVFLVDVLNHLSGLLDVDTSSLWEPPADGA